jgi:DNA polymerase elongation subunit (family B)|tara:strand:+ start:205 stop:981 length:777 start_codon:yes stop_codon:yes gene_type:complete
MAKPKILVLDIETAPNLAYVWSFFKTNVAPAMVKDNCTIMCWSAKWVGENAIYFESAQHQTEKVMLSALQMLLDEADMVVGHNVSGFDMPKIRGRCMVNGITLPSPYKEIDTLRIARKEFAFDSNKLESLAKILGLVEKSAHKKFPGFELWAECLKGNKAAWKEMKAYNIQDIVTTEEVYIALRPYASNHPNLGVYMELDVIVCPKCGSEDQEKRGFSTTNVGKYQRYRCNDCGGWHRSRSTEYPQDKRKVLTVNAVG